MVAESIPKNSVITPNNKEFEILFRSKASVKNARLMAKKYNCTIVLKGPVSYIVSQNLEYEVGGGNPGLTKGGTGDILAGLTVALYAKNEAPLAAAAASFIEKYSADELFKQKGYYYNADDLADKIPETFIKLLQ